MLEGERNDRVILPPEKRQMLARAKDSIETAHMVAMARTNELAARYKANEALMLGNVEKADVHFRRAHGYKNAEARVVSRYKEQIQNKNR